MNVFPSFRSQAPLSAVFAASPALSGTVKVCTGWPVTSLPLYADLSLLQRAENVSAVLFFFLSLSPFECASWSFSLSYFHLLTQEAFNGPSLECHGVVFMEHFLVGLGELIYCMTLWIKVRVERGTHSHTYALFLDWHRVAWTCTTTEIKSPNSFIIIQKSDLRFKCSESQNVWTY